MPDWNVASFAAGWFGLGLGTGLATVLLAARSSSRSIAFLNPWILRGSLATIVAASSVAVLAHSGDGPERAPAATFAREHGVLPERSLRDAVLATTLLAPAGLRAGAPAVSPGAGAAPLLERAAAHRRRREFAQACDVYRQVVAAGGMTADAWADYADALASGSPDGSLRGDPAEAVTHALALEPKHPKALWLAASLAYEEHRYADALATWRTLLGLMPAGSSDARIIEANIAEARRLAATAG